jgi:hypothetical protein
MKKLTMLVALASLSFLTLPLQTIAAPGERHPEIHHALQSLRHAQQHLQEAAHDYGGHRVEPISSH